MNADDGTAEPTRSPRNRTPKGPAAEKVTDLNDQIEMFKRRETGAPDDQNAIWYLCIFDDGKTVRAELSRPIEFKSQYFVEYAERIFYSRVGRLGESRDRFSAHRTGVGRPQDRRSPQVRKIMFTPGRLSLARKRRRLTKKELAKTLGVTPHTVLRYESGDITPPDEVVAKFAKILAFPIGFFYSDEIDEPEAGAASFRSLKAMSAKERDAALAAGSLAFLLSDWVERRGDLLPWI